MSSVLAIGERTYSSWSLRGWLLFARYELPVTVRKASMYTPEFLGVLSEFGLARTVPAALIDGAPVWDTLAIAETLAEQHPDLPFWPDDPAARMLARSLSAEMHAGFTALRGDCPMTLRASYPDFVPSEAVLADLARLEALWTMARESHGRGGPWLFGAHSVADVMFAPVAARVAGFGLPVGALATQYVETQLIDPALKAWRAEGLASDRVLTQYDQGLTAHPWPFPD